MTSIKLCGTRTCCPTLLKKGDEIIIKDEWGKEAAITVEQGLMFTEYVKKLLEQEKAGIENRC